MGLVAASCPSCGAAVEIPEDKEHGYCSYCGSEVYNEAWLNRTIVEHTGTVKYEMPDFVITAGVLTSYIGESKDVAIPDTVTMIQANAFRDVPVVAVRIPASVKSLETCAFNDCPSLQKITLDDGFNATGFNVGAFYKCPGIRNITVLGQLGSNVDLFHVISAGEIHFAQEAEHARYANRIKGRGADAATLKNRLEKLKQQRENASFLKKNSFDNEINELQKRLAKTPLFPKLILDNK